MKNYVIQNGALTPNGNLTGYTAKGERIHVYKRQLSALGIEKAEDLKFPMFCIAEVKQLEREEDDGTGNMVEVKFDRLTALSAFKTREELIGAHKDAALIDVEVVQAITTEATAKGLAPEVIKDLLSVAF